MEETLPPPYPGITTQQKTHRLGSVTPVAEPIPDPDLATCSHPHILLVTVSEAFPTAFHYWTSAVSEGAFPELSLRSIQTGLSLDGLQLVHGFRELGSCILSGAAATDGHEVLPNFLASLVADANEQGLQSSATAPSDLEIITQIQKRLSIETQPLPPQGAAVQLFAVCVFSNSRDALFAGGPYAVWKWAKPLSPYGRKTGFWELEIDDAVKDGEWSAGRELRLLVRGVSEEQREHIKGHMVKVFS